MLKVKLALRGWYKWLNNSWFFISTAWIIRLQYRLGRLLFRCIRCQDKEKVYQFGVVKLTGNEAATGIMFPPYYQVVLKEFYEDALRVMADPKNCKFRSANDDVNRRLEQLENWKGTTFELPEVRDGLIGSIRLRETVSLRGINTLANILVPQVEDKVYGAPVYVEKATVYRHPTCRLSEAASVLWHSDNHFEEILKIMIYLNDVSEKQAPFEYLRHPETGRPIHIKPKYPQTYAAGRVPFEVVENYKKQGYESYKVTGPAGTALLFDDKIIHKGNYAVEGYRDVLVFQIRPCFPSKQKYLDSHFTLPF